MASSPHLSGGLLCLTLHNFIRRYRCRVVTRAIHPEPILQVDGLVARPGVRLRSRLAEMAETGPEELASHGSSTVAVRAVLADAAPDAAATHVTVVSEGDAYRAAIPIDELTEKAWLVLDGAGGFRLVVPDGATLCWNVKNVAVMRVTEGQEPDDVSENPAH